MSVVVVSTGGTIASTDGAGGDATPELTGEDLVGAVPGLGELATVETHDFSSVPSPHLSIEQFYELGETVRDLADSGAEGIVVTMGTDVLEEAAYFLDCCYGGEVPVVFTGAMRTPESAGPDGPGNLFGAVATATAGRARGVLVAFNDRVFAPSDVTKVNAQNVDTFRAPEFGPLATVDEGRVVWRHGPVEHPVFDPERAALTNDVTAVTASADMTDRQIRCAADSQALCLAATGAGHIPPGIIPALEELRAEDVPIVATTRCPEGRLARDTYGFRGSETTLQELGSYYSDLNLQKTRIKTIVALAADDLGRAFDRPYSL
jgi:L-asparaginase